MNLNEIMKLLKLFKYLTLIEQEKGTGFESISTVLPEMNILLEILKTVKEKIRHKNSSFQQAVDAA